MKVHVLQLYLLDLRGILLCLLMTQLASAGHSASADLPRFLPNDGNNVYVATGLLRRWPPGGPRELWRSEIGSGKSAIAESAGRVYTLTQIDKQQYAICLEAATGRTIWKQLLLSKDNRHVVIGPVDGPILDGDRLYVFPYDCENGDLWEPRCPCFCLSTNDGRTIWSEFKDFNSSEGSTPLIVNDTLYVGGGGRSNILAAVDKLTGKLRWKVAEDRDAGHKHVFVTGSSLIYQEVGGIPQVIVSVFRNDVMGVHARTGRVLWHWKLDQPTPSGSCPTPVAMGTRLLLTACQNGAGFSQCLEMTAVDDTIVPRLVYQDKRLQCNMFHTPSICNGAVFGFGKGTEHDALQCTALEDGRLLWQQEGDDWKNDRQLTIADGLIFVITKNDELVLLEASREGYKELGRVAPGIPLGLPQQPMIVGSRLYLRGNTTLICYQIGGG
jgi:outer membrane protein assembly factor BamB